MNEKFETKTAETFKTRLLLVARKNRIEKSMQSAGRLENCALGAKIYRFRTTRRAAVTLHEAIDICHFCHSLALVLIRSRRIVNCETSSIYRAAENVRIN